MIPKKNDTYHTVFLRPFVYLSSSVRNSTRGICLVLLLQIAMLFITRSYDSLIVIAASCAGVFLARFINMLTRKVYYFHVVTTFVQGLIIGFFTPSSYPPVEIFIISLAVMLVVDYAFSGFSDSWVNPVAVIVAAAWMFNITSFPSFQIRMEDLLSNNPSLILIQNGTIPVSSFDSKITASLNNSIFSLFGVSIPDGYISMLWDTHSVIPAFRFNLISLLSSIILISFDVISPIIPACYITVYSLLVFFAEPLFAAGMSGNGDILLALLTSGTIFSSIFLLQWYGTTPVSVWGKTCYGCLAGVIAFLLIGCGTSPVGSVFTVIIINVISLLIQLVEYEFSRRKMQKLVKNA